MKKIVVLLIVISILLGTVHTEVLAAGSGPEAQYERGMDYFEKKDYDRAFSYFQISGEVKGYAPAQNMLGVCYRDGLGTEQDLAEAERFFTLAADQGDSEAKANLAELNSIMIPAEGTPTQAPVQISAPKITNLSLNTINQPVIQWSPVSGASSYEIYRSTDNKEYKKIAGGTFGTVYTNTTCQEGQLYYYKVLAVNKNGIMSDYSNVKSITIPVEATPTPARPNLPRILLLQIRLNIQ